MARAWILSLLIASTLLTAPKGIIWAEASPVGRETVRERLVKMARSFLGLPYRWGGMSERRGVDCSGLVKILFARLHIDLPRTSREQIRTGQDIEPEKLQNGDLVFFSSDGSTPNHVGLYVGQNRFIHAEQKAGHVIISDLNHPWYSRHFFAARRILEPAPKPGT